MELGAALARRGHEGDREARLVGHRHERGLAEAREPLDADVLRVHGLVGLEVVERAARAPRPRAERSPVVRLARLTLVDEADDAFRQPRSAVGLDARGIEHGVAPALRDELFLPGRSIGSGAGRTRREAEARRETEAELDHHGDRPGRLRRRRERHLDLDADRRVGGVVGAAEQALRHDRDAGDRLGSRRGDEPRDGGRDLRHAPVDLAVEVLDDLGPARLPPGRSARDLPAALQHQRVRQLRVRVGLRLVVVDRVRRLRVARIRPGPQRRDPEQVHEPLVILLGRELDGLRQRRLADPQRPLPRLEPHLPHVRARPLLRRMAERRVEDAPAPVAVGPRERKLLRADALVLHVDRRGIEAHQHVRAAAVEVPDLVVLLEERQALGEVPRGLELPVLDSHDAVHLAPRVLVERAAHELDVRRPVHESRCRAVRAEEALAVVPHERQERLPLLLVEREVAAGDEEDGVVVVEVLGVALRLLLGHVREVGADRRLPEARVAPDLVDRDERVLHRVVLPAGRGAHREHAPRALGRLLRLDRRRPERQDAIAPAAANAPPRSARVTSALPRVTACAHGVPGFMRITTRL